MSEGPHVREIGRVEDMDGDVLIVGIYDNTVTFSVPGNAAPNWQLESAQAEEFGQLFVRACWEAGRQDGET
jgi:hypothetical protein